MPQGSGPFGLLMPGDVAGVVSGLQASVATTWPQVQTLMQQPGAAELASDVSRQLAQRFAARVIKFTFGFSSGTSSQTAAAAVSSNAGSS